MLLCTSSNAFINTLFDSVHWQALGAAADGRAAGRVRAAALAPMACRPRREAVSIGRPE